ncbi:MAG: sugar ABC transporter substrate-binding protein [Chloroflexota bacterium]|nr:MAG: sugar ABC transporter substrate-binding protein [Chloroflexota bacterium]
MAFGVARLSRRRLIGVGVMFGAGALLAACQPAATPAPAKPAEPAKAAEKPAEKPAEPKPAAQAPAAGAGSKILLRLNGIDPPGQTFANDFIAKYNQDKKVSVEIDYTDWASSFQKITTGIAGGTAPDIFIGGGLWTPVMADKGGSLELDSYVKGMKDWEDWYDVARKDVAWKGKIYAIPYRMNSRGNIIYRKSLFQKAGLDPAKPPQNWKDALEMAAKLTQKEGDKYLVAGWHIVFNPTDSTQQYEDALFQMGGSYLNEERTAPTNNTPEGEAALQFWVDFAEKGILPRQGMDSGVPNLNAYTAGKIALYPGWPQDMLNTKLNAPQVWDDTLTASPLMQKIRSYQIYVDKYFIFKKTKVADQSWELVNALTSPEVNNNLGIGGTWGLPARKASESAEIFKDSRMKVFVENVKYGRPRQVVPQHFDVQPAMGRHVEAAFKGAKSVKQALKDMDEEVTKILKG